MARIGVDIGHVLAWRDREGKDYIRENYPSFPVTEGAVEVLIKMVKRFGAENIFILSTQFPSRQAFAAGIWLERNQILQRTGMLWSNVFICEKGEEKGSIANGLGFTYMIDDSPKTLKFFPEGIELIAFNPISEKMLEYPEVAKRAKIVKSWNEIAEYFKL
ncbi:MAG: hypothetical protein PHR36_00235 [Patescibacteria group bacterium]|nr:hypothetical protein [Patescibacteria group bacterium]